MTNVATARRGFLTQIASVVGIAALWSGRARSGVAAAADPVVGPSRPSRPIAWVRLNGRGPYRFVFDSAATSSAISGQLLQSLGLTPQSNRPLTVNATHGRNAHPSVHIDTLQIDAMTQHDLDLPLLDRFATPSGDSLLGIAGLEHHIVEIDLQTMNVRIHDPLVAERNRKTPPLALLPHASGLVMVKLTIAGIATTAIVDTGAERSVGNDALLRAFRRRSPQSTGSNTPLSDANGQSQATQALQVPAFQLGNASMPAGPMLFSAAPIFESLQLADRPALLLGMDRIGTLNRLLLDFPSAALRAS